MTVIADILKGGGEMALEVLVPVILSSSVIAVIVTKMLDRSAARSERVRQGYADATRALVAFAEFPYRIRRRTSDDPETLAALASLGHEMQESLACHQGWVAGEHPVMLKLYEQLLAEMRSAVGPAANAAWGEVPIRSPQAMVLGPAAGLEPIPTADCVRRWSRGVTYRFGWHRAWSWSGKLLEWHLTRGGVLKS